MRRTSAWLAMLIGVPVGVGLFTVHYAGGTSYLSDDPRACANCHIMQRHYDGWQKASHHGFATCNDCHLPQGFFARYLTKTLNGYHHSRAFTFQDFHQPIQIKPANARVAQANCLRCHGALVHEAAASADRSGGVLECVHCHAAVGHGEPLGLGGGDRGAREGGAPQGESR